MNRWLCLGALGLIGCAAPTVDSEQGEEGEAPIGVAEGAIVNGTDADIADHPWQVYIQTRVFTAIGEQYFACGGSILGPNWVLTAQHCITNLDNGDWSIPFASPRDVIVASGTHDLTAIPPANVRRVHDFIPYSTYTGDVSDGGDAVLLRIDPPFDLSSPNVEAITLVSEAGAANGVTDPGVMATVTGWGRTDNMGGTTTRLQQLDVPIVDNSVAENVFGFTMTADQIAAGNLLGINGACQGDSGGPLVVWPNGIPRLAGVVSFGAASGCASAGVPEVYARVSALRSWILASRATTINNLLHQSFNQPTDQFSTVQVTLPAGVLEMSVELRNGQGDGDLFIRHGSPVDTTTVDTASGTADCYSETYSSNEFCPVHNPAAGDWFVTTYSYTQLTNVKRVVNYRVPR